MKLALFLLPLALGAADIRIGFVGTDTSHVTAFAKLMNGGPVTGAKIVAAYKFSSPDIESSRSRVDRFSDELKNTYKVEFVPAIKDLCGKVDAIMLMTTDARVHTSQMREVVQCGKPVFVDKPLAVDLKGAREMAKLAADAKVRWFSSSSLRFGPLADELKSRAGDSILLWGPGPVEEHHPMQLVWYGVHTIELLFQIFGPGCEWVSQVTEGNVDTITAKWKDGRMATVHLQRPYSPYGGVVFKGDKAFANDPKNTGADYRPMVEKVVAFFQGAEAPVTVPDMLETFAFYEAAQKSKQQNGARVSLAEVQAGEKSK